MKVHDLMTSSVHSCRPEDSLEQAARLLWEHGCDLLAVVDCEGHVDAAITEQDIFIAARTGAADLADLKVADSMSSGVVACRDDDEITVAVEAMASHHSYTLPVVDHDGTLCGTLSLNDLVTASDRDGTAADEVFDILAAAYHRRKEVAGQDAAHNRRRPAWPAPGRDGS
jgi:predicted transcriptional regulator